MKENKYDDSAFFDKYSRMERSRLGLDGAGEWHVFRSLMPDFNGKRVLDLGCGFGWHCLYAMKNGALSATGIDLSERMLEKARAEACVPGIRYIRMPIEDIDFPPDSFDVVISSLAFHYIECFDPVCDKIRRCLAAGGDFVFSVEHPVFTAEGSQRWYEDPAGNRLHWPVDRYFDEGRRNAFFLEERVTKYHRTLTTYVSTLLRHGFTLTRLVEPQPDPSMLGSVPGMEDEMRRPMMLLLAARKS